jgi:hypothetical protein
MYIFAANIIDMDKLLLKYCALFGRMKNSSGIHITLSFCPLSCINGAKAGNLFQT